MYSLLKIKIQIRAFLAVVIMIIVSSFSFGQNIPLHYNSFIKKADSLYNAKDYKNAASLYSAAFKEMGWKGYPSDRYNAARAWALAYYPDSAFFNLFRIARLSGYVQVEQVLNEHDFITLHEDKRWKILINEIKKSKAEHDARFNTPVASTLDSIYENDQRYRRQQDSIEARYGWRSKEEETLWQKIQTEDSKNLTRVVAILNKYGWLGREEVGDKGSLALFLVIQHSDKDTREKYLPMLRDAVRNKKADPASLALLEDRTAIDQGKKQIYGSQVGGAPGQYYVLPIEDPTHVDRRRKELGMEPLADYLKNWNIVFDIPQEK